MLDETHRVPAIAQPPQDAGERRRVGGMQSGRRLIEDVDDPEQARVQLGREPYPLQFARGQRGTRPGDAQVAESKLGEDPDTVGDVAGERSGGSGVAGVRAEHVGQRGHRHGRELGDVLPGESDLE